MNIEKFILKPSTGHFLLQIPCEKPHACYLAAKNVQVAGNNLCKKGVDARNVEDSSSLWMKSI